MDLNWTTKRKKLELAFGASDTEKSLPIYLTGMLHHLHVRVPNFTNTVTAAVQLLDEDDYAYYEQTGLAKNANHNLVPTSPQLLIGTGGKAKVVLSGAPGSAGTVTVVLYWHGVGD